MKIYDITETHHTYENPFICTCNDCGRVEEIYSDPITVEHAYTDGVCVCGALEPECPHTNVQRGADPNAAPIYSEIQEETHRVAYGYIGVCQDCQATVETGYNPPVTENHDFSQGEACACGAGKPVCPHTHIKPTWDPNGKTVFPEDKITETHHDVENPYKMVCQDCGFEPGETGYFPAESKEHDFSKGNVCACGYDRVASCAHKFENSTCARCGFRATVWHKVNGSENGTVHLGDTVYFYTKLPANYTFEAGGALSMNGFNTAYAGATGDGWFIVKYNGVQVASASLTVTGCREHKYDNGTRTTVEYQADINTHTVITTTYAICACGYEGAIDIKTDITGHIDDDYDGNCDLCSGQSESLPTVSVDNNQQSDGEIRPDSVLVINGDAGASALRITVGGVDVTRNVTISKVSNTQLTVSPGKKLWNPGKNVEIHYASKQIASFTVDNTYLQRYAGRSLIGDTIEFSISYPFEFLMTGDVIASFCLTEKFISLDSTVYEAENENEYLNTLVAMYGSYMDEAKLYGTCEAGQNVLLHFEFSGKVKYPNITREYEQYPKRTGEAVELTHNGNSICEIELYEQNKLFDDLDRWQLERIRMGIAQGFESIKQVYGEAFLNELISVLQQKHGQTPIKIYLVDTDYAMSEDWRRQSGVGGMNKGDFGIIYLNSDTSNENFIANMAQTVAHELQHYYFALVAGNQSFINETFSETVGNMTADQLSAWSGEYGDLYASRDVLGALTTNLALYTDPNNGVSNMCGVYDPDTNTYTDGMLERTGGNYELYAAFGFYLQNRLNMSDLLVQLAEQTSDLDENATEGDHLDATFRALYKVFTGMEGDTATARAYFMNNIMTDFQTYITNCVNAGRML